MSEKDCSMISADDSQLALDRLGFIQKLVEVQRKLKAESAPAIPPTEPDPQDAGQPRRNSQ